MQLAHAAVDTDVGFAPAGDLGDLLLAHSSWYTFAALQVVTSLPLLRLLGNCTRGTLLPSRDAPQLDVFAALQRVYKHYDLPLRHPGIRLRRASFSSYAGGHLSATPASSGQLH
jgi:hypothetical protein